MKALYKKISCAISERLRHHFRKTTASLKDLIIFGTCRIGHPIDSGMRLSITIHKLRVFIKKTLSTQSLINQLLIKRVGLSIVIDNGKIGQGMRSCKCTNHNLYAGGCQ